jgi:hypothetical protein
MSRGSPPTSPSNRAPSLFKRGFSNRFPRHRLRQSLRQIALWNLPFLARLKSSGPKKKSPGIIRHPAEHNMSCRIEHKRLWCYFGVKIFSDGMILVKQNRERQIMRGNIIIKLLTRQRKIKAVSRNRIKCNLATILLSQRNKAILLTGAILIILSLFDIQRLFESDCCLSFIGPI